MAYGFKLTTKIKRADPDFIPSLIGIHRSRTAPSPEDQYFELIELEWYRPGCVETIERTQLVAYDSEELSYRDPIIKVYAGSHSFHTTMSDARRLAEEEEDDLLARMLDVMSGTKTGTP